VSFQSFYSAKSSSESVEKVEYVAHELTGSPPLVPPTSTFQFSATMNGQYDLDRDRELDGISLSESPIISFGQELT
jgi:hypothetical protein